MKRNTVLMIALMLALAITALIVSSQNGDPILWEPGSLPQQVQSPTPTTGWWDELPTPSYPTKK